jgi:hypothetical protein
VLAVFLPNATDQQDKARHFGPSLIHYYEGFVLLALAAAAVFMLLLSQSGRTVMFVSPLILVALGLGVNAYSTSVSGGRLLDDPCSLKPCLIQRGPAGGSVGARASVAPGIAFQVAETGGILLLASGLGLAASAFRRIPRTGKRPTRSHPVWM